MLPDVGFPADEENIEITERIARTGKGTLNDVPRGEVPAHCVNSDCYHARRHILLNRVRGRNQSFGVMIERPL